MSTDASAITVDQAVNAIAQQIEPIAKSEKAAGGNYTYRGIDQIIDSLSPLMAKHGVTVHPVDVDWAADWVASPTRKNADRRERHFTAKYTFEVRGPEGDSFRGVTVMEGMNDRDKASGSALSYAWRQYVSLLFCIPIGPVDPERFDNDAAGQALVSDDEIAEIMSWFDRFPKGGTAVASAKHRFCTKFGISQPNQLAASDFTNAKKFVAAIPDPEPEPVQPSPPPEEQGQTASQAKAAAASAEVGRETLLTWHTRTTQAEEYETALDNAGYWPIEKIPDTEVAAAVEIGREAWGDGS